MRKIINNKERKNLMNIKPLKNMVILEAISAEEKTEGGIILPETVDNKKPEQGKVIAVNNGKVLGIKKGDVVLFLKYSQTEVKIDGKEYLAVPGDSVLAIINTK